MHQLFFQLHSRRNHQFLVRRFIPQHLSLKPHLHSYDLNMIKKKIEHGRDEANATTTVHNTRPGFLHKLPNAERLRLGFIHTDKPNAFKKGNHPCHKINRHDEYAEQTRQNRPNLSLTFSQNSYQKPYKITVVTKSNTIRHPGAMMVEVSNAATCHKSKRFPTFGSSYNEMRAVAWSSCNSHKTSRWSIAYSLTQPQTMWSRHKQTK